MKMNVANIILLTAFMSSAHAATQSITHYDQLLAALQKGEEVRAIISLDHCQLSSSTQAGDPPDMTGVITRMNFTVFDRYKVPVEGRALRYAIATSHTLLTEHRNFGPGYGYARLRVFEDNTAEFHIAHYDPVTFKQRVQINYSCQISDNVTQRGIVLRSVA